MSDREQSDFGEEREMTSRTLFFRNRPQLSVLFDDILPMTATGNRPVRVLVHACADGSEPYTLAIEWLHRGRPFPIRMIASDRSPELVSDAQRGIYPLRTIQDASKRAGYSLEPYFELSREDRSQVAVSEEVRWLVEFQIADFMRPEACARLGIADVVLAQNVLIHLQPHAEAIAMRKLSDFVASEGWIAVAGRSDVASGMLKSLGFRPHPKRLREIHDGCELRRGAFDDAVAHGNTPPYWALAPFDESDPEPDYRFGTIFRKPHAPVRTASQQ
jgi:chemotaxis methyl-accepting protein methylase